MFSVYAVMKYNYDDNMPAVDMLFDSLDKAKSHVNEMAEYYGSVENKEINWNLNNYGFHIDNNGKSKNIYVQEHLVH